MKKIIPFFLIVLFYSCNYKLHNRKNDESIIDNLIQDYCTTNNKYIKKYNFFKIDKIKAKCLYIYRIKPNLNNFYLPSIEHDYLNIYPTNYRYVYGKTFLWRNTQDEIPSQDMMNYLNSTGLIDSSYIKFELGQISHDSIEFPLVIKDDALQTVNYIICENNPNMVKKKVNVPAYYSYKKIAEKVRCKCPPHIKRNL